MSTTPRSTRSKTRAIRRVSDDKPRLDTPSSTNDNVQTEGANSSEDENLWEDVSDAPGEGDNDTKSSQCDSTTSTVRRPSGTSTRRRKRVGNGYTLTRKLVIAPAAVNGSRSGTPTKQGRITYQNIPQETAVLFESAFNGHIPTQEKKDDTPKISKDDLVKGAVKGVSFGSWYIFDVVRTALALLRKPLGLVLFLWLLSMILLTISQTLRAAFAPVCWLPFISSSIMCRPISVPQGADYPKLMEVQTKTFEQLLDETSGGSALSLEVKKAEMATSDLVTLVDISSLQSKELLSGMLTDFVQDAKKTGRRLQKLHSKVGGSVDR